MNNRNLKTVTDCH